MTSPTMTETLYTRAIPFNREQAQPGDRINMGLLEQPYWQTLISVVACADDVDEHGECDGDCAFVLRLRNEGGWDMTWWHVPWAEFDEIETSLPAVTR